MNNTLEDIGNTLQRDFPEADNALQFGMMLQRWIEDEVLAGGD